MTKAQRQFKPQAARLLEQLRAVREQYRGAIAEVDPELGDAIELCVAKLREYLDSMDGARSDAASSEATVP